MGRPCKARGRLRPAVRIEAASFFARGGGAVGIQAAAGRSGGAVGVQATPLFGDEAEEGFPERYQGIRDDGDAFGAPEGSDEAPGVGGVQGQGEKRGGEEEGRAPAAETGTGHGVHPFGRSVAAGHHGPGGRLSIEDVRHGRTSPPGPRKPGGGGRFNIDCQRSLAAEDGRRLSRFR